MHALKGVSLVVEDLAPDIARDGLKREEIESSVGTHLNQSGIKVLSEAERKKTPGDPYLYIKLSSAKIDDSTYAVHGVAELFQQVSLLRNPSIKTSACTWDYGFMGSYESGQFAALQKAVIKAVDHFVSDFQAEN